MIGQILQIISGVIPLLTKIFEYKTESRNIAKRMAKTDALTDDLDAFDKAMANNDLAEMGVLLDELEDPRPRTRGV